MKKLKLLTLGLLLTFIVNGQVKKLSIGVVGSPDFFNYKFKSISGFDHKYRTKFNYSAGLSLQYNFTERLGVKSGIKYSDKGYILDYHWIVIDPSVKDPAIPEDANFTICYLDVPILISYNFINNDKISFFASTGIITGFLINKNMIMTMQDGHKHKKECTQELNSTLLATELNLGMKYNFNENLSLTLIPYFRYGFNKIDNNITTSNPISFGAQLGLYYNL